MKKRTITSIILSIIMIPMIFISASAFAPNKAVPSPTGGAQAQENHANNLADGVLNARLTQMLNMNYVYNEDFTSDKAIIENSQLALLKFREGDEIAQNLVLSFVAGMYGRTVDPAAAQYDFLPAKEGYFAILPRGYSLISHQITNIMQDQSGITVFSDMTVSPHDDTPYTIKVKSIFVENKGSSFGYNIISSDILQNQAA